MKGNTSEYKNLTQLKLFFGGKTRTISGYRCGVNKIFAVLGCYSAWVGDFVPPFWSHFQGSSFPRRDSSSFSWNAWLFKMGHMCFPETSVHIYQCTLSNIPEPSPRVQTRPKPSDFSGRKNPQHAFLRKGNKAVCPIS